MTGPCAQLREEAPALVALPAADPARAAAEAHAAGCEGCAAALREAAQLHALLAVAGPETDEGGGPFAGGAAVVRDLRAEGRRRASAVALAAIGAAAVVVAAARAPSFAPRDLALAAVVVACAALVAVLAPRLRGWGVVAAAAVATGVVAVSGRTDTFEPMAGLHCLAVELAAALAVVAAVLLALRGSATVLGRSARAVAAAGALAGDAALQIACPARDGLPHTAVFHLGGVALAALLGAAATGWRRAP